MIKGGNRLTLLENGADYFPALIAALVSAQREIHLESYIFANDAAADAFAEAIRLAPGEADARINLGIVLSRGADLDTAIAMLDEAIRLRPDLAKGWLARGMVRLRQERPDLALGDLETAVRLDPENPAGCANLDLARRAIESL